MSPAGSPLSLWGRMRGVQPVLPARPTHLCLLRLSALGDVCNLVPTVRALQRHWPGVRITWVIGAAEHALLSGLSGVRFVVYDKSKGIRGMRAIWRRLSRARFDALLQMQQALRASVLSLGINAGVRVGYDRERAKDRQHWFTHLQLPPHPRAHVLESFMDFARFLGVTDTKLEWDIPVPEGAFAEAGNVTGQEPYVVVSPCATPRMRNFRDWSPQGYAEVIAHLFKRHQIRTVLTGGGSSKELGMGEEIIAGAGREAVINAIGRTSIKGLLALIQRARAVIAPDSGPVHMATAVGTPTVGLFATTNPERAAPYCWKEQVVNSYPQAVRTYLHKEVDEIPWGSRVRHPEAMSLIRADEVIEAVEQLLQRFPDRVKCCTTTV